ncbi:putative membrane protein [Marmoricola sp. URHA0025 HA25]
MATKVLAGLQHWQRLAVVAVVLPVLVGLAVLAFAWPTARIEPRHVPVGVIGSTEGSQRLIEHVGAARPEGFDFHLYADRDFARDAIRDRDIYGAFEVTGDQVRLLDASAASPAIAQALEQVASTLAEQAATATGAPYEPARQLHVEDVVPLSPQDHKGIVFTSSLLPLTICAMLAAAATGLVVRFRPAWRQILALAVVSAASAAVVYLIAQTYLGAFPDHPLSDWGVLALTIFAISGSTAGLIALIGAGGLGLGAALMVFVGNPFSGGSSAPELLPGFADHVGQLLPPGAGASALRSTAYFDGNGAGSHVAVLVGWSLIGLTALVIGHHAPLQLAAQRIPEDDASQVRQRGSRAASS